MTKRKKVVGRKRDNPVNQKFYKFPLLRKLVVTRW